MVKVVDVEINATAFKRAFKRDPTEAEIGALMRLNAKRNEGQSGGKNTIEKIDRRIASASKAREYIKSQPLKRNIVVTRTAWSINYLLKLDLNKSQIMDVLHISEKAYDRAVTQYNLPRDGIERNFKNDKR
jgi:hypothetical protein